MWLSSGWIEARIERESFLRIQLVSSDRASGGRERCGHGRVLSDGIIKLPDGSEAVNLNQAPRRLLIH